MRRTLAVIGPAVARGVPVVGLEPSCLLTFRDEVPGLLGDEWTPEQGRQVMLLEEFIAARLEPAGGGFALPLAPLRQKSALLHRSEERRVGKEWGSTSSSRWWADHEKHKNRSTCPDDRDHKHD